MGLNPTTYTVSDITTYVKRQFGDESGVQITDMDIFRWIDAAQIKIVTETQPLKARAQTNAVAGQKDYDLNDLKIHQIESLHYDGERIEPMSFVEAERKIIADNQSPRRTGKPVLWYEWAGIISLWPIPDSGITNGITVYYTKMPNKIVSTTDLLSVPDKYFEALVSWCMSKAYELDEEFGQATEARNYFLQTIGASSGEEMESANMTYPTITFVED